MRAQTVRAAARLFLVFLAVCLPGALPVAQGADSSALVKEGQALYRQGKLGDALLKFEEAFAKGAKGGELYYQAAYCYKTVRRDAEKGREYMAKAVQLLEAEKAKPGSLPEIFYYLSAIHTNEQNDAAKGREVAQAAVALIEKESSRKFAGGEEAFQVARLYSLAGQHDNAAAWYEKAASALESSKSPNAAYLAQSVDQLARYYLGKQDHQKAATWFGRRLELGQATDQERLSAALVMVKAGSHQDAIEALSGFTDDDMATEANYIRKALQRYLELGSPALPHEAGSLDDAALQEATVKAAAKVAEARKEEDERNAKLAAERAKAEPEEFREVTLKNGKVVKIPVRKDLPPPDWQPKDPNNLTAKEHLWRLGVYGEPPPAPPPSPERIAAEKEFFSLLMERLRRGQLLRDLAFARGFASLLFR